MQNYSKEYLYRSKRFKIDSIGSQLKTSTIIDNYNEIELIEHFKQTKKAEEYAKQYIDKLHRKKY